MINKIYIIGISLLFSIGSFAQEKVNTEVQNDSTQDSSIKSENNKTQHFTFRDIPIDGSIENFSKKLEKQDFNIVEITDVDAVLTGRFTGELVQLLLAGRKETVGSVRVIFSERENWLEAKTKYKTVKKFLIEKYGEPRRVIEEFDEPFSDGSGDEMKALKEGKCVYRCDFVTENKNGIITLEISSDLSISLLYVDTENYRKLREQALKEY